MPAPTALLRKPEDLGDALAVPLPQADEDEEVLLDAPSLPAESSITPSADNEMHIDSEGRPNFAPAKELTQAQKISTRKVGIPPHRLSPLKRDWIKIATPLVDHLKLQVRMNVSRKTVELRTSKHTISAGALQQGEDYVHALALGFDVDDAIALLRLDDLYIQSFEIKDVKTLVGEHQGRAIGRIAGKDGKTKFAIENATRTRVVIAGSKIHILGGFKNIGIAREAVVSLILGAPPGKVYGNLKTIASRMKERF